MSYIGIFKNIFEIQQIPDKNEDSTIFRFDILFGTGLSHVDL